MGTAHCRPTGRPHQRIPPRVAAYTPSRLPPDAHLAQGLVHATRQELARQLQGGGVGHQAVRREEGHREQEETQDANSILLLEV